MKIYLIELEKGPRWVFHGETPAEEGGEEVRASTGAGRRIVFWFRSVQERLRKAEGGMGQIARSVEGFLSRLVSPEEPLLRRLRAVDGLTLVHGSQLSGTEARGKWRGHLQASGWAHAGWLGLCAGAMPLCLLTTFLPGPNVVGYWFMYRGLCHVIVLLGIWRAIRGLGGTGTEREAALDRALDPRDDEAVHLLEEALGIRDLRAYLERLPIRARVRKGVPAEGRDAG